MSVFEAGRKLKLNADYDVVVAGGGIAGIAAALAAARCGAKVLLIEREWMLGGLATLGLITIYLPLCDGTGRQVIYGIGEELLRLSIARGMQQGHFEPPTPWLTNGTPEDRRKMRYQVQYNPNLFALAAERLLLDGGVQILYGTQVCAVLQSGGTIRQLVIENKGGRSAIGLRAVVDATGDADVFHQAGAQTRLHGRGNLLASWHYFLDGGAMRLRMMGAADVRPNEQSARFEGMEAADQVILKERRFSGVDGWELSEMTQLSHRSLLEAVDRERASHPDYEPVLVPTIPQVRMTRRIRGAQELRADQAFVRFPDSIGLTGDWRKAGPVYEIPFGALYQADLKNALTAGRTIGADDSMWDIARVIPPCAVTGQAAGIAAALLLSEPEADVHRLDVARVQRRLAGDGVLLHTDEIDDRNMAH